MSERGYNNDSFQDEIELDRIGSTKIDNEMKRQSKTIENSLVTEITEKDQKNQDDDEEDDESFKNETWFGNGIIKLRKIISSAIEMPTMKWLIYALLGVGFLIYYGFAMYYNNPFDFPKNLPSSYYLREYFFSGNKGLALFVMTLVIILTYIWDNVLKNSEALKKISLENTWIGRLKHLNWIVIGIVFIFCVIYLIIDLKDPYNLISILGILTFVLVCCLLSEHPSNIQWKTLITGILIEFILGVFVLRIDFGYQLFKFLGDQVTTFLDYTNYGSELVFGSSYADHFFAFKAMPVIIFFSAIVNLLYYVGAIQYVILKFSFAVNKLMNTSPTESINATANIFLGQTEAPLLIKPFLPNMTKSEIFAVMTGGFATVAGSVLAAYIGFGVPANQLLTASIMVAPVGLAVSKVIYPETKKTKANWEAIRTFPKGDSNNIFEAFSAGATVAVGPVGAIVANLIAFTAIFEFLNKIVSWFFSLVNLQNFGLSSILQYIFWPFAFLMGTSAEDCSTLAKLIGIKVFVNEFVAYSYLGETIRFRQDVMSNSTYEFYRNGTLPIPDNIFMLWNPRSIAIGTFALCGFANVASIGIQIGGLSALAPSRSKVFASLAFKAMIAGNIASFLNACIAGLLFEKL